MGKILIRILINSAAVWVAAWALPGITITSRTVSAQEPGPSTFQTILAVLIVGLIMGVVNTFVRPLVRLLSLPVTILTLGLFTIVINAAMLELAAWLSSFTPAQFTIDSFFWTAIWAALIVSFVSMVAGALFNTRVRH